eukprot:c11117_g1_i1 orf=389-1561(+)
MAKQLNPLYESLIGSSILLPLAYILNALTFITSLNKVGQEKCAALGRVIMFTLDIVVWVTHFLVGHLSNQVFSVKQFSETGKLRLPANGAMSRALCQVLGLVNDTPASSEKYEFARALAERLITQNMSKGDGTLWEMNKVALQAAFLRTVDLLSVSLEELQHQQEMKEGSWFWVLVHSAFGISHQALSLEYICMSIHNFLFRMAKAAKASSELPPLQSASSSKRLNLSATAEKLAHELLWITEKLKECSSIHEVTRRWSGMPYLAKLSLSAHPHIQACLLRVSVMVLKDLAVCGTDSWSSNLKVNTLLMWLPLFCHAKIGFDFPNLMPSEKAGILRGIEQIILSLSAHDQERVLASWLREYVSSTSEWPNPQECFEIWCSSARSSVDMPC